MEAGGDGRIRRGTVWTGTAHALTAMVGSGILALPWCVAQMGWILGPLLIVAFAVITYYTAILLSNCYRSPAHGRRNYTYTDAVRTLLGPRHVLLCGIMQYSLLWGTMIGFTITTATSIAILKRSTCFHMKGHNANCQVSGNLYILIYGAMQIVLSQCPNLQKATFLSVVAAITSFAYALIALGLSTSKFFSHPEFRGSLMFTRKGDNISSQVWDVFQALGNIAFSYTYSILQLEIQDTLKPPEDKVMIKVTMYAIGGTTLFYISLACMAYAAFGNGVPGNVLTGFDHPFWLVDIANLALITHLIGAYQVFAQPLFAIHEKWLSSRWPTLFLNRIHTINIFPLCKNKYSSRTTIHFTLSRLLLRTVFVVFTTIIAMIFPFFNAVLGLLGSISFWPLSVYLPLNMYMVQANIRRGSSTWIMHQILGLVCFIVTVACFVGSIADMAGRLKHAKLFHIEP